MIDFDVNGKLFTFFTKPFLQVWDKHQCAHCRCRSFSVSIYCTYICFLIMIMMTDFTRNQTILGNKYYLQFIKLNFIQKSNTRAYRTDEVGSVICLCTRAMCMWLCSFALACTSSWMSGDVWLIFMADSGTSVGTEVSLKKSALYSRSKSSCSVKTGCCSPCCSFKLEGQKRSRHGTQNNFHDTKSETPKRARPHDVTINDSRLTDTSDHRNREQNSLLFEVKH